MHAQWTWTNSLGFWYINFGFWQAEEEYEVISKRQSQLTKIN